MSAVKVFFLHLSPHQNLNWSKAYPGQKEILNYLNAVASKFGVLSKIQFNTTVVKSVWNEKTKIWIVETSTGQIFKGDVGPFFIYGEE